MKKSICFILLMSILLALLAGCGSTASVPAPLDVPQADNVEGKVVDMAYEMAYMDLAVSLLQTTAGKAEGENVLLSPLSMQVALAMAANGADGQTLQEMESVLCKGISLDALNNYLYTYLYDHKTGLVRDEYCRLEMANSIWIRDNKDQLVVEEGFLQSVSNFYAAEIYTAAFDNRTMEHINRWVDESTDGMIPRVLDKIDNTAMLYLINAMTFDAPWAKPYEDTDIRDGEFTNLKGKTRTVSMMDSMERLYLSDNRAIGFMKDYKGSGYRFAVLMPNEGVELYDYIQSLTAEGISQTLAEAQECTVIAQMPAFSYDFDMNMNKPLQDMGMVSVFDPNTADLSKMAASEKGNLYISNVLHKTFIRVDGMGTQAGAVTSVEIAAKGSQPAKEDVKEVIVDRPFVYMIIDSENGLPIFLGCVTDITK